MNEENNKKIYINGEPKNKDDYEISFEQINKDKLCKFCKKCFIRFELKMKAGIYICKNCNAVYEKKIKLKKKKKT